MISSIALLIRQLNILIDSFSRFLLSNRDSSPQNIVEFSNHPILPHDALIDILLRLPAKSLCRFKSVCKEWHYIISSSDFINWHYNHPNNLTRLVLYFYGPSRSDWYNEFCTYSYFPDYTMERHEVPDHLLLWGKITCLRGPCNGIFCIYVSNNKFALWNPTTRRLRPILCSPSFKFSEIGFGIDPVTGDYKIVLIQSMPRMAPCYALYTSSNNSWQYLEEESLRDPNAYIYYHTPTGSNAFLNGFYYWLRNGGLGIPPTILAFDMHGEIFQEIEGPSGIIDSNGFSQLLLFNDSVAIIFYDRQFDRRPIEIWLMERKGHWTKFSSVVLPHPDPYAVGFWGGNKILLTDSCMYDLDTHYTTQLNVDEEHSHLIYHLLPIYYKESLFSVKGEYGNQDFDTRSMEGLEFLGYEGPNTKIDLANLGEGLDQNMDECYCQSEMDYCCCQ